jgi:hypothetical protein
MCRVDRPIAGYGVSRTCESSLVSVSGSRDIEQCLREYYAVYTIARQRLGKHIPAQVNARDNRTSVARQRRGKHALSTV